MINFTIFYYACMQINTSSYSYIYLVDRYFATSTKGMPEILRYWKHINSIHSKSSVPKVIKFIFRNVRIQTDIEILPSQANIHPKLALSGGKTVTFVTSTMLPCTVLTAINTFVVNVVIELIVTQNVPTIVHLLQTSQ